MAIFLKILFKKTFRTHVLICLLCTLAGCNITRNLGDNQYLVEKNRIIDLGKTKIPKEDIESFIRQKPNRKILSVIPFSLWLYNQVDKEKLLAKKEKRDAKYDRINAKRIEKQKAKNEKRVKKGKRAKEAKLKDKDKLTFRESLLEVAEAPVIYDSALARQTSVQIKNYLFSKGYFYGKVNDSVIIAKRKKRAKVFYILDPGKLYSIENIKYDIPDEELAYYIYKDTSACLIKINDPFDSDLMQKERERITTNLQNNGYFYFEPDYITYDVDSNVHHQKINITLRAKKFPVYATAERDSVSYINHPRFYVKNIYIITELTTKNYKDESFRDTTNFRDFLFLHNRHLAYKKDLIANQIDFFKGQVFQKRLAERAYRRLLNLGVFRSVLIQYIKDPKYSDQLDCYVVCTPHVKQAVTVETEGTNTYGNLGIDGSILYHNKNLFRGAELFELKMTGAIVAQKQFNVSDPSVQGTFNTIQFGPELKFSVPRAAFPFSLLPFKKEALPRTFINSSLNYQSRPEFNRSIAQINYGFNFRYKRNLFRHEIIPLEVYLVKAILQDYFRQDLINTGDYSLLNSFEDHMTTLIKYSLTYNNQTQRGSENKRALNYIKSNFYAAGNILRGLNIITNQPADSLGRYYLFGIPFAQFLKTDFDYRLYVKLRKKRNMVYRVAAGIGVPLANLNVLPYEQSFFSGGPNGIRAWPARTLGPGGYKPPADVNLKYDKIGDIMLEGNLEYRFRILQSFYGALFVDAGNIWLLKPDTAKPNGEFRFDKFYNQIAIGTGVGIRWDLTFVIIRVDLGIPLKDPKLPEGERWLFLSSTPESEKSFKRMVLNFGIGYPF